jgi:hypothetical protein
LDVGDIVQFRLPNGGEVRHTMMVTGKDPVTGDLLLSYHTNNRLNRPLSNIEAEVNRQPAGQRVEFIYWHVLDVIP